MNSKIFIWVGLFIGSTVGAYLPLLWGAGVLSLSAVFTSTIGGVLGIWAGYKISKNF